MGRRHDLVIGPLVGSDSDNHVELVGRHLAKLTDRSADGAGLMPFFEARSEVICGAVFDTVPDMTTGSHQFDARQLASLSTVGSN